MTGGKNGKNGVILPHGGYRGPYPLLVAVVVFLVAAAAAAALIRRLEQHRLQGERARVLNLAGDHAFDLQRRLDRAFSATYALAALVRQGRGEITDFDEIARQLLPFYPGVVALQLAPGGVIRQTVPLAGNEKALGHDLLKDKARDKEAILARDTGKLTLAGPFDLMQGGVGAAARLPVFLGAEQGNPVFWGFTTVLIRFPEVLDGTLLSQLTGRGFAFELWRIHPDTGKKQVIASSSSAPLNAALEHPIQVPNGTWTLSITPVKGWGDPVGLSFNVALGLLFSLLLAWLAKLLIESKAHETMLEALVAERTAEIRESEERLRRLEDNLPDSYIYQYLQEADGTSRFLHISAGVERVHGVSRHDVLRDAGTLHRQIDPAQKPALAVAEAASLRNMSDFQLELHMRRANGEWRWLQVRSSPRRKPDGQVVWDGVATDITEHKKLETQYLHAQKMESIGTLAGGVAHDFNNILTVIVGLGHITLMKMVEDDSHRRNIEGILKAAERATRLTKELLLFSRKQESERRPVDLNDIIGNMENFLHRVIGEDVTLNQVLHNAPLPVLADSNHLEQVLMNLAVNARDAMPQGGEFILRTEQIVLDEAFTAAHGYGKPGAYALLTVSDTGAGMDKETLRRIFEPFFSTKEVGKGTGLGLAVAYGIIKQHDGFITVYSEPGQGSTFRIYLPLTSAAVRIETGLEQEQPIAGGMETILLAEDNDLVRDLVTSVLMGAGYRVIVAVDGEEAVRKFRENADSIELLLFDLIMPRMNGKEAFDEIHKLQPGVKTIFASGYSPDIAQQKASLHNGNHLIFKPVSPQELLKKVRSVLDGTT
jgi:PAS domain S-box-containing protein